MIAARASRAAVRVALAVAMLMCLAVTARAQEGSAELRGVVRDADGGALPGVSVTVRHQESGVYRDTSSNADGTYFCGALAPGTYAITASLPGFRPYAYAGIRLEVGRTTTIDVTLAVGTVAEAIVVFAETPLVDITSKEIGGHISSFDLAELPSVNRSFVGAVALLPGIVPSITSDAFGAEAITLNGIDSRNANFMIDGASNNDDYLGQRAGTQTRTPIEAIHEFEVVTHQFDAQFGRTTGSIVNAVTKQGTNTFRGSAFGFVQDAQLARRDYFTRLNQLPKADTHQHLYGGVLGGPIVRNKAHFFASVERVQQARAVIVNIPARPEFNTTTTSSGSVWNTLVRVDQQINGKHTWALRWLRETSPQGNLLIPMDGRQVTLNAAREESDVDQTTVATLQSILGNTRTNTFRISFTRENVAFANPGFNDNGRHQDLLPPTLQYLTFVDQQSDVAQARIDSAYAVEDTLSWFVADRGGSHHLTFGTQYLFSRVDSANQATLNGVFEFGGNRPFTAADPSTYPERLRIRVPGASEFVLQAHALSAFAQDKWQIGNRLTLTAGLRYDLEVIPVRVDQPATPASERRYPLDANNVAPRLGLAYALDDTYRAVVRGGYGLFYDRTHLELIAPLMTSGVFSDSFIAVFPANAADPGPSTGQLPSHPLLRNGPVVDTALLRQLVPPGARSRNTGTVHVENPERQVPYTEQFSVGYKRQLTGSSALSLDYVHTRGHSLFMSQDLNPGVRADTSRTSPVARRDPQFTTSVLQIVNTGRIDYDALELHVDRRLSGLFSAKASYTWSYSRGNTSGNGVEQVLTQQLDDLRLADNIGPTDFDRRHNLVVSGTARMSRRGGLIVSAVARAMSGLPFTLVDSATDPDRNGILFDVLPAGTYEGTGRNAMRIRHNGRRNGAYGPGFFQLDMRIGYRLPATAGRHLDLFAEIFNLTNRVNFDNPTTMVLGHPVADRRMTDFLVLRSLRAGGIPTTAQLGLRLAF